MREMLFYALTSALTCIPYSYSVHYSLTPKKKTLKSLLLYSLLICVLLWIKLFSTRGIKPPSLPY